MKLTDTNPDTQYLVEEIQLELATKRRLESLGMTEGSKIIVMRKKRNGAVIIKIRGTRFALGKEIVRGIQVRERAGKRDLT
ncbi:FeoA family protein [Anaerostipes sp.]|uniref:FeoA family protein n=1 Tax=Anaerostipes sp. TaxID=1872530 RepID=UPI0025B8DB10|nr:FeoA family protein [Anaerostipes sp.]MBS7007529.1 ferrous iron transport protein A [Anaerostipes sp.]